MNHPAVNAFYDSTSRLVGLANGALSICFLLATLNFLHQDEKFLLFAMEKCKTMDIWYFMILKLSAQHQMLHLQHCHIAQKEIIMITSSLVLVTLSDGVSPIKSSFGSLAPPKSSTSPAASAAPLPAAFSAPESRELVRGCDASQSKLEIQVYKIFDYADDNLNTPPD